MMKAPAVPRSHAKWRNNIPTVTVEIQIAIPVETATGVFQAHNPIQPTMRPIRNGATVEATPAAFSSML
jgi:hypothetical protein